MKRRRRAITLFSIFCATTTTTRTTDAKVSVGASFRNYHHKKKSKKKKKNVFITTDETIILEPRSTTPLPFGDPSCPCIATPSQAAGDSSSFDLGPNIISETYGIGCATHDLLSTPCVDITTKNNNNKKSWCQREWCYIDPNRCALLNKHSSYIAGWYYSYATCYQVDTFRRSYLGNLKGKTLKVGYNANSGGWTGAYNNDKNNNWTGPAVDFISIAAQAGKFDILPTTPPGFLRPKSDEYFDSTSSFDFCVYATSLGILDLCVSQYTGAYHAQCGCVIIRHHKALTHTLSLYHIIILYYSHGSTSRLYRFHRFGDG